MGKGAIHDCCKNVQNQPAINPFSNRAASIPQQTPVQRKRVMFLTQGYSNETHEGRIRRANQGESMTTAADIFSKIEEFLSLSQALNLTLAEEQTLMSLDSDEWAQWRGMTVPAATPVPSLVVRRLDYAIALLQRMVASSAPGANWTGPGESRL
jgi:hypothetical protein